MACRVCERETMLEHFAMLEASFLRHGRPESIYTNGFSMFGVEGEDLKSQFGRMCRAFGIVHRIAPSPQAKGKIERAMRTFQHRLVVVLRAEGADTPERGPTTSRRATATSGTPTTSTRKPVPSPTNWPPASPPKGDADCALRPIPAPCACTSRSTWPGGSKAATGLSSWAGRGPLLPRGNNTFGLRSGLSTGASI